MACVAQAKDILSSRFNILNHLFLLAKPVMTADFKVSKKFKVTHGHNRRIA